MLDQGFKRIFTTLLACLLWLPAHAKNTFELRVQSLESQRIQADYALQGQGQLQRDALKKLLVRIGDLKHDYPNRAEPLALEGLVLTASAGAVGGMRGFEIVKNARVALEAAVKIDERVLQGAACVQLGVIYYRVPEWPVGFGDTNKAMEYFAKGLKISPDGLDSNYYYGKYLLDSGQYTQALQYLRKALASPPVEADDVRRAAVRQDIDRAEKALNEPPGPAK
jgi:tetratricopeptide (TPR) repeat protein